MLAKWRSCLGRVRPPPESAEAGLLNCPVADEDKSMLLPLVAGTLLRAFTIQSVSLKFPAVYRPA